MIDETMFQERVERLKRLQEPSCVGEEAGPPEGMTWLRLLTYPFNGPGISIMTLYVFVPFLWILLLMLMPLLLRNAGFFIGLLVKGLVVLSTVWYLAVCVRASAEGELKAPNLFEFGQDDSFSSWFWQFIRILIVVLVCIGPAFFLRRFTGISVEIYYGLLGAGLFFLPMALLSVVMFDALRGLNPVLIIASVFSTFFSYFLIVLLFSVPIFLLVWLTRLGEGSVNLLLLLMIRIAVIYLLMLAACLLGRFFYNNEEKLRWDV